jgi:hypothetical protein
MKGRANCALQEMRLSTVSLHPAMKKGRNCEIFLTMLTPAAAANSPIRNRLSATSISSMILSTRGRRDQGEIVDSLEEYRVVN